MIDKEPYKTFTREQFLFYELRMTARLMEEGLTDDELVDRVLEENLFQFPTEKSTQRMAKACIRRLRNMDDESLIKAIATEPQDVAKQICLYAMIMEYRVIREFMVTVIGEKYRVGDNSFGKIELNSFFNRLQEQDDNVASWSEATIKKLKQVMLKLLVDAEYLDDTKSTILNPVWLQPVLENVIREKGEEVLLPAFNRFE